MKTGFRILFFMLIAFISALIIWPILELVLFFQKDLPSMLILVIGSGIVIGGPLGCFFAMSELIYHKKAGRIPFAALAGLLIGAFGGLLGTFLAQGLLLIMGNLFYQSSFSFSSQAIVVSRVLGWMVLGAFIGMAPGIQSRSFLKLRNGFLGGILGGLFGGIAFEIIRMNLPGNLWMRLSALLALSLFIALFYALIEQGFLQAWLFLLNGPQRGQSFLLNRKKTIIGSDQAAQITLEGYRNVYAEHAKIMKEKNVYTMTGFTSPKSGKQLATVINDSPLKEKVLINGDIVRVGSAQLQFILKENKGGKNE